MVVDMFGQKCTKQKHQTISTPKGDKLVDWSPSLAPPPKPLAGDHLGKTGFISRTEVTPEGPTAAANLWV